MLRKLFPPLARQPSRYIGAVVGICLGAMTLLSLLNYRPDSLAWFIGKVVIATIVTSVIVGCLNALITDTASARAQLVLALLFGFAAFVGATSVEVLGDFWAFAFGIGMAVGACLPSVFERIQHRRRKDGLAAV